MPPYLIATFASRRSRRSRPKRPGTYCSGVLTERALLHRLLDQLFHRVEFLRIRRLLVVADHVGAKAAGADKGADVDRRAILLEAREVFAERPEIEHDLEAVVGGLRRLDQRFVERRDRRSLPGNLRRHALRNLAGRSRVHKDVEFRLAEHVDEARSDYEI